MSAAVRTSRPHSSASTDRREIVTDRLLKFTFHNAPVRGEVVRLETAWQAMIQHHGYPAPVMRLLGEMTAAAALLATNIKFAGSLIMQIHGDGPVQLLVVECQPDLRLRATAKLRSGASIDARAGMRELVNASGQGRCAITLDPTDRLPGQQPYQGIVSLRGDSIAQALENYMRQSEQLESRLWLAADARCCAGVLLQKLPDDGGLAALATDTDAWERTTALTTTLTTAELLSLAADTVTRRLFWQERLDHYRPLAPRFECRCSRERIGRMLLSLGSEEVDSIIAERGSVEVTCDFCNARQIFDAIDVAQLFRTGNANDGSATAQH
jgi:molecular chaperone Hsp33